MDVDELKIFLHGLPPDCQASTLKDFLEAVCDFPGAITNVSIPSKKTYAFVTLSRSDVAMCLLRNTLLYCDDDGELYQVKACPYVAQQYRRKNVQDDNPMKARPITKPVKRIECKPVKYAPPDHVQQFTPDYSMLSLSKPKRKRKRQDNLALWFGDVGSTSSRKRPKHKKKKKKVSKQVFHRSESFQCGNLCPQNQCTIPKEEDAANTTGVVDPLLHELGQELSKRKEEVPVVEEVHVDDLKAAESLAAVSSHMQVIIDHDYLGPLCLQFGSYPSVADVKNELLERTGLPVKDQSLYCNGKKLCDKQNIRSFLKDGQESLSLVLSLGALKGGVRPEKAPDKGASESTCEEEPPEEDLEKKVPDEGATGGEDPPALQEAMEMWGVEKTALWFSEVGLHEKYASVCRKEGIGGRALLLLAGNSFDQLVSVFQMKQGPEAILMESLQPHLKAFDQGKPQTAYNTMKTFSEWTVEKLCNWLRELYVPEECSTLAEEEEINGKAFLVLRKSGKLKNLMQLNLGSWVVLEHELFLHLEKNANIKRDTSVETSTAETTQLTSKRDRSIVETKEVEQSKEPLAIKDPSTNSVLGATAKGTSPKEAERLSLLQKALQLDIAASPGCEDAKECVIRSIFVKRGGGANALEALFNFIVITKDEMSGNKPRKLWSRIKEKTKDWIKLLPATVSQSFQWDCGCESFVHVPTSEKVSLREDGNVGRIFLEKLSEKEYTQSLFVVLVDKQLLDEKKTETYYFCLDKKRKHSFSFKLNVKESKYHASFDPNSKGQDLKWSKHCISLMKTTDGSTKAVSDPCSSEAMPSLTQNDVPRNQTPRPFTSEFGSKYYNEGFVLKCWETGSKDLIKPAHEFKLFRRDVNSTEDDSIKKFVFETLRFACGCLNERTNGTIHFGVADEVEDQTCGRQPREIVGSWVSDKPRFNEKLTEFIDKCFVGDSRSNVHNCIRPPVFIPVKGSGAELHSDNKVVVEVDIEPRYTLCAGEVFKARFKCLGRGREEAAAYIRHGSKTQAIVELQEMEDYIKNRLPKLDEERKRREREHDTVQLHGMEKQESLKHLYDKLKRLLCANKKVLDSSMYPVLVLSKPGANMNQEFLDNTFRFIQNIKWQAIVDFDDEGSDSKGLLSVFKSCPETPQCDIHEAQDYDEDENVIEGIDYKTHWIFGNGYVKLNKEAVGFRQWNNSKRKRGLSLVIQSLAKKIPEARAVVLFLLFSKEYEPMADTFKDFCTYLDGPNQLVYVAENSAIVKDWEAKLSSTCLEEHELRERGVVGMSWSEFQECVQQMVCGIDRHQRYVTMTTGSPCPLRHVSFSNIDVVSAKECEELRDLDSADRLRISLEVEIDFYRGYPVTWTNFWFTTEAQKNHVLRRDNYPDLKKLIEKMHSRGSEGKVQTITIYHHIGAGASTMARQALWDFRCNPHFPYRCAVVTKIDDGTSKELLLLRKVGYGEDSELPFPPVLALVEDTDDFLFRELRSQVVEHAQKLPRTDWPVCVFLYCKPTQKPDECHSKEKETSVFLEQHLSSEEVDWFKDKYTEMKGQFNDEDPARDFETYANENLISFMIMKENFNPKYASSIVERNLCHVTETETTLLEYTSLLNIYNPYPVFASCFDTIMLSSSILRRKIFRDWVEDLTHSARIFLREMDVCSHLGTGKAVAVVHPILASELLDKIAEKKQTTVSQIALEFLKSPLLEKQGKSFTSTYLCEGANRMLKHRKKYEYGDDIQTKFSPLIEKILYVKETDEKDGNKTPTEQSIDQAAEVLREGLDKFKDPMLAQQMARLFYVNAAAFSEAKIDSCFTKAFEFCKMAIEMSPNNSFLFDTMGRIHETKIKILYGPIRKDNRIIETDAVTPVLSLAFDAIKWFKKSLEASVDHQNNYGFPGILSMMFYLLDVMRCARLFRGQEGLEKLKGYLSFSQVVPDEVKIPWSEFHECIKDLRNQFSYCMEGLAEDFTIYKRISVEERMLPNQIAWFKAQYHSYFSEENVKWNTESLTPEERWECRWLEINKYLAGNIFSSVFTIHWVENKQESKPPRETLQLLKGLAHDNYRDSKVERYKDLVLIISTSMALHSPYGKGAKQKSLKLDEEYRETYKYVDKLFALEVCDEGNLCLYAHLFKVMFLWPRKDLELSNFRVQDFYDALKKLRERWDRKCRGHFDADKVQKQKVHKNMTFKEQTRQYTTLFYLGRGSGLDVFVHINELTRGKGSVEWENRQTKERLKRLTGVVESKNIIRMHNPLESSRTIDIYYSSLRQGQFSKEEVSFFLGFSWPQPIAFDVKYTNRDYAKRTVETSDPLLDDQVKFTVPKVDVLTYEMYTSRMGKLTKKVAEIAELKKKKTSTLDENQRKKLSKELEIKGQLEELERNLNVLVNLEEEIFD